MDKQLIMQLDQLLQAHPSGIKARKIAKCLGVDKRVINKYLYDNKDKYSRSLFFNWSLNESIEPVSYNTDDIDSLETSLADELETLLSSTEELNALADAALEKQSKDIPKAEEDRSSTEIASEKYQQISKEKLEKCVLLDKNTDYSLSQEKYIDNIPAFRYKYGKLKKVYLCDYDFSVCPSCGGTLTSCKSAVLTGFDKYIVLNGGICRDCLNYYLEGNKRVVNVLRKSYDPIYLDGQFLRNPNNLNGIINKTVGLSGPSENKNSRKNIAPKGEAEKKKTYYDPNDFTKWNEHEFLKRLEKPEDENKRTQAITPVLSRIDRCPKCKGSLIVHLFPVPLTDEDATVIDLKGLLCHSCNEFYIYKTLRVMTALKETTYKDNIDHSYISQDYPNKEGKPTNNGSSFMLGDEYNNPNPDLNPSNAAFNPSLYGKKRRPAYQSSGKPHSELNTEKPLKWWN